MIELTEKDMALLDAYKSGNLTEGDKENLEKRFLQDSTFKTEAKNYWAMLAALETVGDLKTEQFLKDIDKTMPPYKNPNNANWWTIGLIVLGLVLTACGIWYFFFNEEQQPKMTPIVAAYFKPYPAIGIHKGNQGEVTKSEALRMYDMNDFEKAIPLLQKAFDLKKDTMLLFYKGISLIGNGQAKEGQVIFETLQNSEAIPLEITQWYLALAYIETNQKEKALPLLKMVVATEGGNQREAGELLRKLK